VRAELKWRIETQEGWIPKFPHFGFSEFGVKLQGGTGVSPVFFGIQTGKMPVPLCALPVALQNI
jgi:hypothetical protein